MPIDHKDVVIVGAGPAGSTLAHQLKQQGLDVLLVDKKEFPRDKICAGWITPAVVESLALDLEDYAKTNVLQPLTGFRVGMIGEPTCTVEYGMPMSYGIRRCEFDHYLLKRSRVPLKGNTKIKSMVYQNQNWLINDEIEAPLLIGAGGHFCPVARQLGAKLGQQEPVVAAQEVEFEMTDAQVAECEAQGEIPELYFCRDLIGYGWLFRKGRYLNIGLGRQDNHKLSDHVKQFVEDLKAAGRIPKSVDKKMSGHAYLLYGFAPRPLYDQGIMLIGDSAGLAYAQSGEGIRPAIESALLAAEVIKQCHGQYDVAHLAPYGKAIEARFGPRQQHTNLALTRLLPQWLKQKLAARMLATQWFSKNYVLNRWFFHLEQKPLKPAS